MMMTHTLGGFCRDLLDLDDDLSGQLLDPEAMAARFVDYFRLSTRPTLEELTDLAERAGFGTVRDGHMEGLKGAHIGQPGGRYHIYHREDLSEGSKTHTVLHEMYEIILEGMAEIHSPEMPAPSGPNPVICRQADRFAAAALMQPDIFLPYAQASGLDVTTLHEQFGCAYSSVALRLAELVRDPPLLVVLYERKERGDPAHWPAHFRPGDLTVKVVKRTAGFAPSGSPLLCGKRRGVPWKHKYLPSGSLAECVAQSGMHQYTEGDGLAVAAQPVLWRGQVAKVIVVAVPWERRRVLEPQLGRQRQPHPRNKARVVTVAP